MKTYRILDTFDKEVNIYDLNETACQLWCVEHNFGLAAPQPNGFSTDLDNWQIMLDRAVASCEGSYAAIHENIAKWDLILDSVCAQYGFVLLSHIYKEGRVPTQKGFKDFQAIVTPYIRLFNVWQRREYKIVFDVPQES